MKTYSVVEKDAQGFITMVYSGLSLENANLFFIKRANENHRKRKLRELRIVPA